jgi:hypothetical protein
VLKEVGKIGRCKKHVRGIGHVKCHMGAKNLSNPGKINVYEICVTRLSQASKDIFLIASVPDAPHFRIQ